MMHRAWSSWFTQILRSQNHRFWPELSVSRLQLHFESTDDYEIMHKAWRSIEDVPHLFLGHLLNFEVTRAENLTIWIQFE